MAADLHRQRCRRHHQDHHRIAEHGRQQRHDEGRLADDLQQRAAAGTAFLGTRLRNLDELHDGHRDQHEGHYRRIAAGEFHRLEEIDAEFGQFRANKGGDHAAGQNVGNGPAAVFRGGRVGRGEPVVLPERVVHPEQQGAEDEQREIDRKKGEDGEARPGHPETQADRESDPAAHPAHEERSRDRAQHGAQELARHRQGREAFILGDEKPGERRNRGDQGRPALRQGLTDRQQDDVAPRAVGSGGFARSRDIRFHHERFAGFMILVVRPNMVGSCARHNLLWGRGGESPRIRCLPQPR